jgi:hypothetical protein
MHIMVTYTWRTSPCSPSCSPCYPCCSLCSPLYPFSTYLAPSSCDRNRPPPSQVACKLNLFAPPFTQLSHPFQLPRTPTAQRLTTTTLGLFRSCYAEHSLPEVVVGCCGIPCSSVAHLPDSANLPYRSSSPSSSLESSLNSCLSQALCLASSHC